MSRAQTDEFVGSELFKFQSLNAVPVFGAHLYCAERYKPELTGRISALRLYQK